jgi:hypothetical protein
LRKRSHSLAHGNFDDDAPTMDSLLRRVLNQDDIALSYQQVNLLTGAETLPLSVAPGGEEGLSFSEGLSAAAFNPGVPVEGVWTFTGRLTFTPK